MITKAQHAISAENKREEKTTQKGIYTHLVWQLMGLGMGTIVAIWLDTYPFIVTKQTIWFVTWRFEMSGTHQDGNVSIWGFYSDRY